MAAPQALKLCQMVRARSARRARRGPCCRYLIDVPSLWVNVSSAVSPLDRCFAVTLSCFNGQGLVRVQWMVKLRNTARICTHETLSKARTVSGLRCSPLSCPMRAGMLKISKRSKSKGRKLPYVAPQQIRSSEMYSGHYKIDDRGRMQNLKALRFAWALAA